MKLHIKLIVFFTLILCISCTVIKNKKFTDLSELNLNANVKSIKSQSYFAKDSAGNVIKSSKGVGFGDFAYKDVAVKFNPEGSIINKATLG